MARTRHSVSTRKRHKKWLKRAQGYRGRRSRVFKIAKEAVLKAGQYAYRDRRHKKSDFRKTWQVRINAAARENGLSYSKFIHCLKENNIALDRKVLSQVATDHPHTFKEIVAHCTNKKTASK
jgi:large subunit ribosomal protein L20